jgi:hypothetical protein
MQNTIRNATIEVITKVTTIRLALRCPPFLSSPLPMKPIERAILSTTSKIWSWELRWEALPDLTVRSRNTIIEPRMTVSSDILQLIVSPCGLGVAWLVWL